VLAMHGSGENAAQIRIETGYGFERLADEHGFAVVCPDAYEGYWDACRIVGGVTANGLDIDDMGFLTRIVDKLVAEIGADRRRVFATVMIMNGTEDPLVPFNGGEVNLLGFFDRNGKVLSSRASGQYFADLNHIAGAPETHETQMAAGVQVEQVLWRNDSIVEVALVVIHGGGHGIPQPYRRRPRLQGPSPKEPNGPAVIWAFFERQRTA
jgi:polyhydroxybutyrate depolymerase